jgi:protein gp37
MGTKSSIEWTEATWNPLTGCTKISPGCKFCYAERMALRLQAMGQKKLRERIQSHTPGACARASSAVEKASNRFREFDE